MSERKYPRGTDDASGRGSFTDQEIDDMRRRLASAVRRVCPRWLAESSEDIVQVALLRAVNSARRDNETGQIATSYLEKVAYCAMVDEIRHRRMARQAVVDDPIALEQARGINPSPEYGVRSSEIRKAVHDCLKSLIRPRKQALVLHLIGNTGLEIAKLLSADAKRIENLVYRGLADLRACLEQKGVSP